MLGDSFELVTLRQVGITEDIPETGATLDENASLKARYVYERTGLDCFADDTGLEVEALNGAPGVHSPMATTLPPTTANCSTNWRVRRTAEHASAR